MYSDRTESLDVLRILLGSLHLTVAFSSREPSMPQGGTSKDENGAAPLGQGGADRSPGLRSGWFEAVEGSEARSSRKIPNHSAGLLGLASPILLRRSTRFRFPSSGSSRALL